jgi:hypothetical protein
MAAYMAAATPGEFHKHLQKLEGNWKVTGKMWMDPAAPPTETSGTAVKKLVMGGRYLREEYSSVFMGMPFQGLCYTGYDNLRQQYSGVWLDDMSTQILPFTGSYDADRKAFTMEGDMIDAATGQTTHSRMVTTVVSEDKHLFESFGFGPEGKEIKMMELVYERQ